jgi:hypothetical protein
MKTVRCKFKCVGVGEQENNDPAKPVLYSASFMPVTTGSSENEQFFAYTPGGRLDLAVLSEQHFEEGKQYYLDITPAE